MLRFDISFLPLHFIPQNQKSIHFACFQLKRILHAEPPSYKELLEQRQAFARHQRLRTFLGLRLPASPNNSRLAALIVRQETAPPLYFQTLPSATLAIPPGTIRKLPIGNYEVERDDQFFLSFSSRPHSAITAVRASTNSSSGPISINDSAVAGTPSSSRPRISSRPQRM